MNCVQKCQFGKTSTVDGDMDRNGDEGAANRHDPNALERLKDLCGDALVLLSVCAFICILAFLTVWLFRVGNVGRSVVEALSACSGLLSAASWPLLIVALAALYRRQFVRILDELPWLVRNYGRVSVVSPAQSTDEADASSAGSANVGDANGGSVSAGDAPKTEGDTGSLPSGPLPTRQEVLDAMQRELGTPIYRDVNLFSNRAFRFDGAIVGRGGVTGIVVRNAAGVDHEKEVRRLAEFCNSISERDRRDFRIHYCVVGRREALAETLVRLRGELCAPIEFQFR